MTGECLSERLGCLSETLNNLERAVRHSQYLHAANDKVMSVFFMMMFTAQLNSGEHTLHTGDQQVLEEPSQACHSGHEPA